MELLGLFVVFLLIYLLIAPIIAWVKASSAKTQSEENQRSVALQARTIEQLRGELSALKAAYAELKPAPATPFQPAPAVEEPAAAAERTPAIPQRSTEPEPTAGAADDSPESSEPAPTPAAPAESFDLPAPLVTEAPAAHDAQPALEPPPELPPQPVAASTAAEQTDPAPAQQGPQPQASAPPSRPPPRPTPPREPSAFELLLKKSLQAAKDWLFGGNLVAKIGLLILFIGVAFLLRFASSYVVVPIEVRLSAIAAGAIALLGWGWRIRIKRPGIALPVQGAALATLMLVTFGAFKIYKLLPGGATFGLLLVLVAFTCILAVLQNALWLAIFGIAGGFAVPILTSSGGGSHVALFSYYALLNAGILAIALQRSWRILNLIGFAFTFLIGTAWGVQRYEAEHYLSSQLFLALFVAFYIAIAVLYAWRQAPKLKSYVDGTLVFGVPTVAMGLQYGMVKDFQLGAALSAVGLGLVYAGVAAALWRWRRGSLRLLVESFFALAVIFGTLAIPLAFDGRWTSAAWALEGAGIIWIGLRQRQPLVWRFGLLVQFGSWIAFFKSLTGLDPLSALQEHLWLGFAVLGATAVFLALSLRRYALGNDESESNASGGWSRLASVFMVAAVLWILAGLWVEIWLRISGEDRASLLVVSAIALVYALQWLARKARWQLPALLAGGVTALTGMAFIGLMTRYMNWSNQPATDYTSLPEVLANGALIGGGLLSAAAWVSALAFKQHAAQAEAEGADPERSLRYSSWWLWGAVFWASGFAIHGLAHALSWLSGDRGVDLLPWYAMQFWPTYAVLLAASGLLWKWAATRWQMPNRDQVVLVLWPALTWLGIYTFVVQLSAELPSYRHLLSFDWIAPVPADGALLGFLGGPISGSLVLVGLLWVGLTQLSRAELTPTVSAEQRPGSILVWSIGLIVVLCWPLADCLALLSTHALVNVGAADQLQRGWLSFVDARLLWLTLIGVAGWLLAQRRALPQLTWLALPAALTQLLASLLWLGNLYIDQQLPRPGTGLALLGLWLGMAWLLKKLRTGAAPPRPALQLAHFGRVIAPWLMLPALVSLNLQPWLGDGSGSGDGWVVAGLWPDYIAAWLALAVLILALRQVRRAAWPVEPLQSWYGNLIIPLAALWSLLLVIYWNLRQDGSMQPLPYLPLLNPLDLTTAFVALLLADLWNLHRAQLHSYRHRLIQLAMALVFAWFNLMLLRSAAQYLGLPYRFEPLYQSQFIQAMLSLVWTLCAFALMRYSLRRASKALWMTGAALLAVVVVKLFVIDLKSVGSVARIVSFMGVGGLMLLIGYLAPLPRAESDQTQEPDSEPESGAKEPSP